MRKWVVVTAAVLMVRSGRVTAAAEGVAPASATASAEIRTGNRIRGRDARTSKLHSGPGTKSGKPRG